MIPFVKGIGDQQMNGAHTAERTMRADARRNRTRILDAARELFAQEHPDVQIGDVAKRAGVGVGTVYRHFPDKHALMGALVRERFELFNARLRAAVADEETAALDALTDALRANADSIAEDAATRFAFMRGGERAFAHAADEAEEFLRLSRILVERAQRTGALRKDFDAEDIPMIMCGVCATIDTHKPGWSWHRHLELVISGMRARV
jgi:AcrR family transcriptional regulator